MENLSEVVDGRGDSAPEERIPAGISDADRAANPFGAARAERDRDDQGRFASRAKEASQQQEGATQEPAEGNTPPADAAQHRDTDNVPRQAMLAERRKYQELEASIPNRIAEAVAAEFQKRQSSFQQPQPVAEPQQPPPFWENPDAATDFRVQGAVEPVATRQQQTTAFWSHKFAEQAHGADSVRDAIQAIDKFGASLQAANPEAYKQLEKQLRTSMDPVGDVVQWHKRQQLESAVAQHGGDTNAYIEAEVARRLVAQQSRAPEQDPEPAPAAQPPRLPTSFAAPRSGGPRGASGFGGARPLSEIMPRG